MSPIPASSLSAISCTRRTVALSTGETAQALDSVRQAVIRRGYGGFGQLANHEAL